MKKLSLCILALCLVLISGCGSSSTNNVPIPKKTFSKNLFQIDLTESFFESSSPTAFAAYDSDDLIVRVLRHAFSDLQGTDLTGDVEADAWAQAYLSANHPGIELTRKDGLLFFSLPSQENTEEEGPRSLCFFFKGSDAFYLVIFSTEAHRFPELESSILDFAQSVTVA